jgi:hypothetical protein
MIGTVADCQVSVFRYADEDERAEAFKYATTSLNNNPQFMNRALQGNRYSMVGPGKDLVVVDQTGRYIVVVIGHNRDKVTSTSSGLIEKLKGG